MNVTPEMLLFLAGKMGLDSPCILSGEVYADDAGDQRPYIFNPATDDAQFGRLVVWAAMNGAGPSLGRQEVSVFDAGNENWLFIDHDSTPDSIRAAAVVAVARALGYQEGKE